MVANPMKKKQRISFLLGMVITLVVCIIIGVLIFVLIGNKDKAKEQEEGALTYAYRLKQNVKSGEEITQAKVESVLVTEKAVPAGAFPSKAKVADARGKETWVDAGLPGGYKSKVDLNAGTIIASNLVYLDEDITNDLRYVEYNMLTLPTTVEIGSYVDIRLTFPNGQDLIVVSKKQIKSITGNTVGFEMTEGEIAMMESAIVEAYIMTASKLYVTQYVEPGTQEAATRTYVPTGAVQALIAGNPNISGEARGALTARFDGNLRSWEENELSRYDGEAQTNIESGIQEQVENARAARQAYLSGLSSY